MTIGALCKGRGTLEQFDILNKADVMFDVGRFYGGILTPEQVDTLTPKRVEATTRRQQ